MKSPTSFDWLLLTVLVATWGSSFAMTKVAVGTLDPAWVMAFRLGVAALALVPYALLSGRIFKLNGRAWGKFTWLAVSGYVAPFLLISWGTRLVPSGVAGLLMGSIPLMMVVAAHFLIAGERLTATKSVGFILGFAGVAVLMLPKTSVGAIATRDAIAGEAAILAACLCYVAHSISAKRLGFHHPILQTAAASLVAAIIGMGFAAVTAPLAVEELTRPVILSVIGLGLIPTALAYVIMYKLIDRAGPSFTSYSNYLVPVFALLLGAAALGEQLSWNILAALTLILAGIAVSRRPRSIGRKLESIPTPLPSRSRRRFRRPRS
jgi:drug/metabolite transporter (DMT)-like permease